MRATRNLSIAPPRPHPLRRIAAAGAIAAAGLGGVTALAVNSAPGASAGVPLRCEGSFLVVGPGGPTVFYQHCASIVGTSWTVQADHFGVEAGYGPEVCGRVMLWIHNSNQSFEAEGPHGCSQSYSIKPNNQFTGTVTLGRSLNHNGTWVARWIPDAGTPSLPDVTGGVFR